MASEAMFLQVVVAKLHLYYLSRGQGDVSSHIQWVETVDEYSNSGLRRYAVFHSAQLFSNGSKSFIFPVMEGNSIDLDPERQERRELFRNYWFPSLHNNHPSFEVERCLVENGE